MDDDTRKRITYPMDSPNKSVSRKQTKGRGRGYIRIAATRKPKPICHRVKLIEPSLPGARLVSDGSARKAKRNYDKEQPRGAASRKSPRPFVFFLRESRLSQHTARGSV